MNTHDHLVLVPSRTLGDLLDLTDRAIERLDGLEPRDPLQEALRGAVAEVRTHSLLEPSAPDTFPPCVHGCGGRTNFGIQGAVIQGAYPQPDETGMIPMASCPGCTERYHGAFTGASVFLVGVNTEHEQMFVRGHRMEALRYANDRHTTLDHVHSTSLPHEAVVKLLGA